MRTPRQKAFLLSRGLPLADPYLADDTIAQAGEIDLGNQRLCLRHLGQPKRTMRWPSICPRRAASWRVTR